MKDMAGSIGSRALTQIASEGRIPEVAEAIKLTFSQMDRLETLINLVVSRTESVRREAKEPAGVQPSGTQAIYLPTAPLAREIREIADRAERAGDRLETMLDLLEL